MTFPGPNKPLVSVPLNVLIYIASGGRAIQRVDVNGDEVNRIKSVEGIMVESGIEKNLVTPSATAAGCGDMASTATMMSGGRCGLLETRVRGAWYRVMVALEPEYLSISLDESCEPTEDPQATTLNGTIG